jgi:DUF4097 and DUF4098 domain-containing protein YvlB
MRGMRGPGCRRRPAWPGRRHVLALLGAGLVGAVRPLAAAEARTTRIFDLPSGRVLELDATIAEVRITGTAQAGGRVEVVRTAPTPADLDRVPLSVDEDATRVRIAVRQAGTDPGLRATVRVEVPADARIAAVRVVEGRLDVADFAGTLTADVRRGPIVASRVSGVLRLETGIGAVDVRDARLTPGGLIRLRTFNGNVRLAFAEAPTDARVMALALNGTVTSQLPLNLKTKWGPRWGEATIGRGEPVVSLDVVTGDIRIEAPGRPG